jgi:polyisoprenoid-binding protein YceI
VQLRPLDARHRIEVDAQLVGMVEILGAHRAWSSRQPRFAIHASGSIARNDFGLAPGWKAQGHDLDPVRPRARRFW